MPYILPTGTYDKVKSKALPKEVVIPAWNDIIHIARPPSYTDRELAYMRDIGRQVDIFGRSINFSADYFGLSFVETEQLYQMYRDKKAFDARTKERAMDMLKSPTPSIAANFGVIMTAIDDVQDFTTTVGVLSRMLGRVFKPFEALAIGAFTFGETLNRLNLVNRMTGGEISKLCRLLREMKGSSHQSTTKADVEKRMKRLFPSKGEFCEIAQTTDQLFGLGISLGPLVGLVEDAFFGAFTGATIRFRDWEMSDAEAKAIVTSFGLLGIDQAGFGFALEDDFDLNESAANVVIGAEHLTFNEYASGLIASIESGLSSRAVGVKKAIIDTWEIIVGKPPKLPPEQKLIVDVPSRKEKWVGEDRPGGAVVWKMVPYTPAEIRRATPRKKTKIETRQLMQSLGVDPYGPSGWPVEGLGLTASLQEIQEGYEKAANKGLQYWRKKLGVSDEGLFLDACVKEIGLHAASMFCDDNGVITESIDPHILIYIHALESGLTPPSDSPPEKFTAWALFIKDRIDYYNIPAPNLKILQDAYHKFF